MAIESLPGAFLGTVTEFGPVTGNFPGVPGLPFDGIDYGIATGTSAVYYVPGVLFSVAGGGVTTSPASAPSGGTSTTTWDGGNK